MHRPSRQHNALTKKIEVKAAAIAKAGKKTGKKLKRWKKAAEAYQALVRA